MQVPYVRETKKYLSFLVWLIFFYDNVFQLDPLHHHCHNFIFLCSCIKFIYIYTHIYMHIYIYTHMYAIYIHTSVLCICICMCTHICFPHPSVSGYLSDSIPGCCGHCTQTHGCTGSSMILDFESLGNLPRDGQAGSHGSSIFSILKLLHVYSFLDLPIFGSFLLKMYI